MNLAAFYFTCFLIGLLLSLVSFIGGRLHLPHFHLHFAHGGNPFPAHAGAARVATGRSTMPHVNFATITAFLAWFGAAGYLLTSYSTLFTAVILLLAIAAGIIGATVIFWFVVKLLLEHEHQLDPADYDRIGVIARVISPIRAGGVGEIIFSQAGSRNTCGARNETGEAIARGAEVIITHYEHGIAFVKRWEELARHDLTGTPEVENRSKQ
jgi:membrane protein implicated in regulation of membrane protease activity